MYFLKISESKKIRDVCTTNYGINWENSFTNSSSKITFCSSDNNIIENLNKLNQKTMNNVCENNCFEDNSKLILDKNVCVLDCKSDSEYIFEYNNICYQNCPEGFYGSNNRCEKCYYKCKNCIDNGDEINNNCTECYQGMTFVDAFGRKNCYKNCDNYYFLDEETETYNCTESLECPEGYKILYEGETRCVKISKDEQEKRFSKDLLKNQQILEDASKGNDYIKLEDDIIYIVSTSENQKNNTNKTISSIDLKECEDKLKEVYNISEPLIIIKIDYYSKGIKIPIIGYEIYHPENKSKLDLNYCKDIPIQLNIPVKIDEEKLFKYDPNSEYYNDDCNSYTTDNGTDILINDRKKEFLENNMSLCEILL